MGWYCDKPSSIIADFLHLRLICYRVVQCILHMEPNFLFFFIYISVSSCLYFDIIADCESKTEIWIEIWEVIWELFWKTDMLFFQWLCNELYLYIIKYIWLFKSQKKAVYIRNIGHCKDNVFMLMHSILSLLFLWRINFHF